MTFPNPVDAVIFDMDGLLLDTEALYALAIVNASREVGFEISKTFCHAMIGIPETECNVMIQEHFGPSFPMEEYLTKCGAQLDVLYEAGISVKLGVFRLIDQLTQFGILKAIATSSSRRTATHHLKKSDLFDRFSVVITRDDVQHGKPSPQPYLKAAASLGVEPGRCLSLEDSLNGIRSAKAAGTMPIMVPDLIMPTEEIRSMCIAVVRDLHEVRQMIVDQYS